MSKVKNKACIRRLSNRSFKAERTRNIVAVLAIILTTVLFTSVFTIAGSLNASLQESNFRQVGGDVHGGFKFLTAEEVKKLSKDPLIKEKGVRTVLGIADNEEFSKAQVEVSAMDATMSKHSFCIPEKGTLPREGTKQIATDTRVLKLLGIKKKIGEKIHISYSIDRDGETINKEDTFTLSGYWEFDPVSLASQILLPQDYADQVVNEVYKDKEYSDYSLDVMFKNSLHIKKDLLRVLKNQGYQSTQQDKDNYIGIGVNWAYTGAQMGSDMDGSTIAGIIAVVLLILLAGYFIINNIFRISVTGDIRYYGLLKTVGTTGKQIKKIIRRQALILSAIGIPIGLIAGWFIGARLTPKMLSTLNAVSQKISFNPLIFIGAAVFAVVTVLLSVHKPAHIAAKVSPVEAVRYTENTDKKKNKKYKKSVHGTKIYRMALSNLNRNKRKTIMVIVSISLALAMLTITYTFSKGFDMDKYLKSRFCADFILGNADYFQVTKGFHSEDERLDEEAINTVNKDIKMTDFGRIYGQTGSVSVFEPVDLFRKQMKQWSTPDKQIETMIENSPKNDKGDVATETNLYGMEDFPMSKLKVIDGDLSKIGDGDKIAAVVDMDDYGKPENASHHAQVGDKVEVLYVDEAVNIDARTGKSATEETPAEDVGMKYIKTHTKTYTVCARITMINSMSYRYYGSEKYVLPANEFKSQTGTDAVMNYMFNVDKSKQKSTETYMKDFTSKIRTDLDFESKANYEKEFNGMKNMVMLFGGALSLIIGIIGILNFINAVVTSIMSRQKELAILQAVGMTGRQLKQMLIMEGCLYGVFAVIATIILDIGFYPINKKVISSMFWFYSPHFTMMPIAIVLPILLLLGIVIPILAYRVMDKKSLVDRIRDREN